MHFTNTIEIYIVLIQIKPAWHAFADIPLHSMWADNSYWLRQVRILGHSWPAFDTFFPVQAISGNRVRGYFLYSGLSQIRDHHVEFL